MRKLFPTLLLALLTAPLLFSACTKDEPAPCHCAQATDLPRPHYPGNPYPLPYLPDAPTVPPTPYSVDCYLEPDTLVYSSYDSKRDEYALSFDATPNYTGGRRLFAPRRGTSRQDSLVYAEQARLHGEDGSLRAHPLRAQTLLMNVTALRALLYRADGSHTDISDRCTLTYTSFEPYIKSGYSTFYARYTRRFDEMDAYQLRWIEPYILITCKIPPHAADESLLLLATLADGRTLRGHFDSAPTRIRYQH